MIGIKVIVFDFDGTLVQSNKLKYDAYFELFPGDSEHVRAVTEVLTEHFEASRYVILRLILARLGLEDDRAGRVKELAAGYNEIVLTGTKTCLETPNAENILRTLSAKYPLYLSSTTPERNLEEIVTYRKWAGFFRRIFGFPREKADSLRLVMELEKVAAGGILVVGDGESDRLSAAEVGCEFLRVENNLSGLEPLIRECQS